MKGRIPVGDLVVKISQLSSTIIAAFSAAIASINPAITDADWMVMNHEGILGSNGYISTLKWKAGSLYVGGRFSRIGSIATANIARWNGSTWDSLGYGSDYAEVGVLAADDAGKIYVGDSYANARVRGWNGSAWKDMGWTSSPIRAMECDRSGNLSIGGGFAYIDTTIGYNIVQINARGVAQWNGTTWKVLGAGCNNYVNCIARDGGGNLYAGGRFDSAGAVMAKRIAKWNGSEWSALGSGLEFPDSSEIRSMAFGKNSILYVGGRFDSVNGTAAGSVAAWNGMGWSIPGAGVTLTIAKIPANVYEMATDSNGNLYVSGSFNSAGGTSVNNIAEWDGKQWIALGNGLAFNGALTCDNKGVLYSKGDPNGALFGQQLSQWDGSSWSPFGKGMNGCVNAMAVDGGGNLYIGGDFTAINGVPANHAARWNGSVWAALGAGVDSTVRALVFDRNQILYAGGDFKKAGGLSVNHVAQWNGSGWKAMGSGMNRSVLAMTVGSDGSVFAGGIFDTADGRGVRHVAQWNGSAWSGVGSGTSDVVNALYADKGGNLFVGGSFIVAGDDFAYYLAKWDGLAWSEVGKGAPAPVSSVTGDRFGNLYAVCSNNTLVKCDGGAWSVIDSIRNFYGSALLCDSSGTLYAGGSRRVVQYAGGVVRQVGSGTDSTVKALVLRGSTLFVGGSFFTAGGKVSPYIAAVGVNPGNGAVSYSRRSAAPPVVRFRHVGPNLVFSGITAEDRISLYSLCGRRLELFEGVTHATISGISPQPLVVLVERRGRTIANGLLLVQ